MTTPLEPGRFPLWGSRLIEASAGTGKTWTIAALYLRLVLGHGGADAYPRPLLPAEILVMTFTRAATRELSDRIRTRLTEAARCFRGEIEPAPHDALLPALLADYPDETARRHAAWRLAIAAEGMDDAAIHTIDAWCQRMLREHAFDSGNPFDEELAADEDILLVEAAQDYWRQHCYPLSGGALDRALGLWAGVDALVADMRELAGQPLAEVPGEATLGACIARVATVRSRALGTLAAGWVDRARAMKAWLDAETAAKSAWDGRKLQARYYTDWLDKLEAWALDPLGPALDLSDSAKKRLCPEGILEARKPDAAPIALPDNFAAFAALIEALAALPDPKATLRAHAAAHVARRFALLKRRARSFGFTDMLERLERALAGPQGERLRNRILAQYPAALIDEFQDTSPLQYRVFDLLYRTADNDPATALLLIGDPKQSIYGFRGADIYSYLQARRATATRHYALDTNYRSTAPLVAAVNHWFEQAEARDGDGAFRFRRRDDSPLPFEAVGARGRAERFHSADGPVPAIAIAHDLALRSKDDSMKRFAARCAERIVCWLNDDGAGFEHPTEGLTRLRPADIAVLVRTGREAAAVRAELRRRGVASVYLSDKDSVFASDEARDLLRWLRAAASPLDAGLLRAALATRSVGLSIEELARLAASDEAFDARSEQMRTLHAVWRDQGVLTMLRQTLHLLDLPARWLTDPEGERRLTNFLHLAELLQTASAGLDGEQALVRWLATRIRDGAGGGEEQVLRLESDADLVKVVTVHKSKGLEYPVVCLPFACSFRPVERRSARFLKLADTSGTRELKLDYSDEDLERAEHERLREDLRLFYVALTRARHALWMGFAAIRIGNGRDCQTHRSAPGYLVGGPQPRGESDWGVPLEALATRSRADGGEPSIVLQPADEEIARTLLRAREALPALQDSPVYAARFERRWSLGSFSSLVRNLAAAPLAPTQIHRPAEDERGGAGDKADMLADMLADVLADLLPARPGQPAPPPWHRFPKGALAGDFLHGVLEWLAGEGFALDGEQEAALRRRCERANRGDWADEVVHWMRALLASPLPGLGAPLQDLRVLLTEMEFWLPAARLDAQAVDALCHRHLLAGRARPALPQRELRGMLMGFADLVFEHRGRYWVLDYKSNSLGDAGAAYEHAALEAAMAHHRYDVQAALYLLALHRLLRARLGGAYDPARQLGGAIYFFLRGIDGPTKGEYRIPATPELLNLLDALDTLVAREEPAA